MILPIPEIRRQFPALNVPTAPIFLDNPAGTQVPQRVIDAVTDYWTHMNANSGGAFRTSVDSDAMVRSVRQKLAVFLQAPRADEIVIGANMTTLNFALSRALAKTLSPGDEIILTHMDHDANVAPWLRIAEDGDLTVRWINLQREDGTLDLASLDAALSPRTRIVATVHASNALGTINPVAEIARRAHAVGALHVVDAVQSAPHLALDVQAIGCDFLLCSSYKFFGPHQGVLWGRYELLAELPAYKVRPSKDVPPYRWETGTPAFELIAGIGAALDYLASLGEGETLRAQLTSAFARMGAHERELSDHLLDVLEETPGVHIAGITDRARLSERVPTVVFTLDGFTPEQVASHLAAEGIYVWDGNYYAVEVMKALGRERDGMVRVGPAHYNTHAEIDQFGAALRRLLLQG
ncbi:MAG TPA: cysteine desulfurase-like protein [Candidatus Limnocylindrales bacterium]|nr:cysteine desulfurase-like protein [Candidatus Limnocylindrales bacterium]